MPTNTFLLIAAAIALLLVIAVIIIICELHAIRHHQFENNVLLNDATRIVDRSLSIQRETLHAIEQQDNSF